MSLPLLVLDTSTPATVAGLMLADGTVNEARHDPAAGERPGHATQLLALAAGLLEEAGLAWRDLRRIGAGVGPGGFTGLRIGLSTARGLAQGLGIELAAAGSLHALALGADEPARPVIAAIDARRGEAFAAAWAGTGALVHPAALGPDGLEQLVHDVARAAGHAPLAAGDGAVRFRERLTGAGAEIPPEADPRHLVRAAALCRIAAAAVPAGHDGLRPDYVRAPDAIPPA